MIRQISSRVHAFSSHPLTNLVVAGILIGTSIAEAGESLIEPILSGDVGSHHGVLIFGVAQALRTLPELIDAMERLFHGPEAEA